MDEHDALWCDKMIRKPVPRDSLVPTSAQAASGQISNYWFASLYTQEWLWLFISPNGLELYERSSVQIRIWEEMAVWRFGGLSNEETRLRGCKVKIRHRVDVADEMGMSSFSLAGLKPATVQKLNSIPASYGLFSLHTRTPTCFYAIFYSAKTPA